MTNEEYLEFLRDTYYPSLDDPKYASGYCLYCGKKTTFEKFSFGFHKYCTKECASLHFAETATDEQMKEIRDHRIATIKERYGVENIGQKKEFIEEAISKKYGKSRMSNPPASFGYKTENYNSKTEKKVYEMLSSRYSNVISQYTDERYPFKCDYYIPEEDLFIEIQKAWSHNKHPYDPNSEEDQKELKRLEDLASKEDKNFYKNVITYWTQKDVIKRETAKRNNLRFVEIFHWRGKQDFFNQIDKVLEASKAVSV